jgi:hypothetical protein
MNAVYTKKKFNLPLDFEWWITKANLAMVSDEINHLLKYQLWYERNILIT